jgi:HAE1 family hydrophobic/amphiphilic exporter-1/multidrug efflux pump
MEAVDNDPTFSMSDVNLKFNKPELNVTIDRKSREFRNIGYYYCANVTAFLKRTAFCYFMKKGKQYEVIGQFDQQDRSKPLDLTSMYVKKQQR